MRGIFFSLPLVAWLFGHWTLIAMTFIYLISLYVWEDESLNADMVSQLSTFAITLANRRAHCDRHLFFIYVAQVWEDGDREAAITSSADTGSGKQL
jgi:hypothetical protein